MLIGVLIERLLSMMELETNKGNVGFHFVLPDLPLRMHDQIYSRTDNKGGSVMPVITLAVLDRIIGPW
ncbi:MAG: hypothetical protein A2010_15035 [Nitrospirae bacterium GWD2_57_9]|nr:MAG: hypothetical protein A2010_15035 [Nitrospirae bacterium GWD2_57_9]